MFVSIIFLFFLVTQSTACNQRAFPSGPVCVCNADDCDTAPDFGQITGDDIKVLYTSISYPGFNTKNAIFGSQQDNSAILLSVNSDHKYQKIFGFGGAFTDAVGINYNKLSDDLQHKLLNSYFGKDGIGYTFGRVPIGGIDFSPRSYTLADDEGDEKLEKFSVQYEDLFYKIPLIHKAMNLMSNRTLNLIASAWTAPLWMKNKQIWSGGSVLKPEYYQTWANYHMRFFDEYQKYGIKFWGFTLGNAPSNGYMKNTAIPSMGWSTTEQAKYIKQNLGPTLRNSVHKDLKLLIHDDTVHYLPFAVAELLDDDEVLQYVDGVAMHWYVSGSYWEPIREFAFTAKKDTFTIETETCLYGESPDLGQWSRAAQYIDDILLDFTYGYSAWLEWNLALDYTGGPSQINTPADSPIIISEDYSEFYRQPTYYVIGHFSKYVLPDSVRIDIQTSQYIRTLAFLRPDNIRVVSIFSDSNDEKAIQLTDGTRFSSVIHVPAQSITTLLYSG